MFGVSMIFHSYGGHLILVKNETTILPLPAKSAKILIYDFEDLFKTYKSTTLYRLRY